MTSDQKTPPMDKLDEKGLKKARAAYRDTLAVEDRVAATIRAYLAHAERAGAGAVPAGWKLVPEEPTREMWAAMGSAVVGMTTVHHDTVTLAAYQAAYSAAPTPPSPPLDAKDPAVTITDEQIKHMVDRFLVWKLPKDFSPDGGISATRPNYAPEVDWLPRGTNLLDVTQATAMVRHMVDGLSAPLGAAAVRESALEEAAKILDCHADALRTRHDALHPAAWATRGALRHSEQEHRQLGAAIRALIAPAAPGEGEGRDHG